jgi:hypothetical protein
MYFLAKKKVSQLFKVIIFFSIFIFSPYVANAATISLMPATGSYEVGDRVTLRVVVSSNTPFNAVSGVLTFPSPVFSVDSVSKAGSVLDFWVTEPVVSTSSATIKFEGVALGGPVSSGTIIVVNLRANSVGSGTFAFRSGQILANDGEGTDITGNLVGATFSVKEATIKPVAPKTEIPKAVEEVSQPKPTLHAPEIVYKKRFGEPSILGTSEYKNTQALVTFITKDGTKVFVVTTSDGEGSFNIGVPHSFKRGFYNVTAVMVKTDKTNSEVSDTILIEVGSIFSDIGFEVKIMMACLLIAFLYLLIGIYFHLKKDKNKHKNIKKEMLDVENVVRKSLDILREDIIEEENQKSTLVERKRMMEIKKEIDTAEKVIKKEFDSLE